MTGRGCLRDRTGRVLRAVGRGTIRRWSGSVKWANALPTDAKAGSADDQRRSAGLCDKAISFTAMAPPPRRALRRKVVAVRKGSASRFVRSA